MNKISHYNNYLLFYCVVFLFFYIFRIFDGLTITQLVQPCFFEPHEDPLVWIFIASGMPTTVVHNIWISLSLDVLVPIIVGLVLYFSLKQKKSFKLILIHLFLFNFYLFVVFSYPSLSIKKFLGLALLPILFLAKDKKAYQFLFSVFRYYVLFIFSSSALWKIGRGSIFQENQFVYILQKQHLEQLYFFPDHIVSTIVSYLIAHPEMANLLFLGAVVLQLIFVVGFISRRWDHFLAFLLCVFVVSDFMFMRIEYWEFLVFLPLFFSLGQEEDTSIATS